MKGHNYELPDCIVYILERRSREEFDFWDIAALTGDTMALSIIQCPPLFAATVCPAIWQGKNT